jgi:phage/conjugal plasmid C-4 type zinc finger TraR family protein
MADDIDLANIEIERERERALAKIKTTQQESGISNCLDCDIEIPKARKEAVPSAVRCIDCQSLRDLE